MKSRLGMTLLELLVASFISSIALLAAASVVLGSVRQMNRDEIVIDTRSNASMILNKLTKDIRMAGSGMVNTKGAIRWQETNHSISLPIVSASNNSFVVRVSERDRQTVLTENFTPGSDTLGRTISVLATVDYSVNDVIYISGLTAVTEASLRAEIASIDSENKQITIKDGYWKRWKDGTTYFPAGSMINAVDTITYESPAESSEGGIVVKDKYSPSEGYVLAPRSWFSLTFIDASDSTWSDGYTMTPSDLMLDLKTVLVQVTVDSGRKLHYNDAENYRVQATGRATPRNVIYSRINN